MGTNRLKNILLIFSILFIIANCSNEEATVSAVSISPTEPLILNIDRQIIDGFFYYSIPKPNITFQLKIDNKNTPVPLTIVGLTLVVNGPKGLKVVPVSSTGNIFSFQNATFQISPRAFFAEVPAYQAGYCMHKVSYLRESDTSNTCSVIAADPSKIELYGVSAAGTTENEDGTACCPNENADLSNLVIIVGGLQDMDDSDSAGLPQQSQTYTITAHIQGLYGTFMQPIANYTTQVVFTARAN